METFTGKKPTDAIFNGERNLRCWIYETLPHAVDTIIDVTLLQSDQEDIAAKTRCIKSIMEVAWFCTVESFSERQTMTEVEFKLRRIKSCFLEYIGLIDSEHMIKSCFQRYAESIECDEWETHTRISFQELECATNGFNQTNLLGLGRSSFVYKGRLADGRLVAVKRFNLQEGGLESFKVHFQALPFIRHRNVVKILKYCSEVNFKALVVDYMPKGSLQDYLQFEMNILNYWKKLNIMIDVASALCYLHSMGVIHCNLDPTNVLLDEDMVARISGFSIAKCLDEGIAARKTTRIAATPGYMAPEYLSTGIVSRETDVYSFGILLMETFTTIRPAEEMNWRSQISYSLQPVDTMANLNFLQADQEQLAASAAPAKKFLHMILRLTYCCTSELPDERKTMTEVESELVRLKKHSFLSDNN